ncbi:MAG: hypothetical protein E6J91_51620 [Deltaproteobacteria bacterium]|nr:MAG: hypothetical protein E6J91_51620 [Deltaproteobacteria bacterium]
MIRLYAEAPFIWQLALRQEFFEPCQELLQLASAGTIELALPLTALVETLHTARLRSTKRNDLNNSWRDEARQLARTDGIAYQDAARALTEAVLKTAEMASDERKDLNNVITQIGACAKILLPTIGHFADAYLIEAKGLTPYDALALAGIIEDARNLDVSTGRALLALDRKAVEMRKTAGITEDFKNVGIKVFVTPSELAPWLATKGVSLVPRSAN